MRILNCCTLKVKVQYADFIENVYYMIIHCIQFVIVSWEFFDML
jgi:hypothetical protein